MTALTGEERAILLEIAEKSIFHSIENHAPLPVDPNRFSGPLRALRATFVTLKREGELRGCIGSLEASRPLVADVAHQAYAAAFRDPRFPPLAAEETRDLEVHISVLSPPEPLQAQSEAELVEQLLPGIDGLILQEGPYRSTFLPAVWESLPEPHAFLHHLRVKAGLPMNYWSPTLRFERYRTESFGKKISYAKLRCRDAEARS